MLKASAGGGGRGIRLVTAPKWPQATTPGRGGGGGLLRDGSVYMEKYVHPARHIEVRCWPTRPAMWSAWGERDCSVQRHHQKLIEESPSPAVSRAQRKKLMALTAKAVKAIGYVGWGPGFLLDQDGRFWFMEMNLRLQVEHGVTEMLTNVDLVKWQIRTAAGGVPELPPAERVVLDGACLECRINATRPGTVTVLHVPAALCPV